ncbi:MAG TPA: hypothetical protein VN132_00525, partial [Bdellovibrio sp.]|nr:hypothetical protein [Bdellovibrio sp.]
MKKLIFAVILVFSQLSWAIGLRCESIFETRESNSSALNILVQNIITGNQTLNYDAAKDIVSLSLDETRQSVWNELVQKNENRGKRPSIPRYALKSEADVYLAVVKFMRKEVELSLRGSKAQFIFQGVGFDRNQRQDPLVEAIFHEVHFLNDLRENFNSSPEVNAVNYSAQNFLQRNLKLFWRIFLSSFRDTRVQICNSTIRSQKMDLDSQISDPGQLRAYIGKNIRLETGLRTTFKYYNRIQMALLAG